MRVLVRYLAGYVFDFFRERVTADDFRGERVRRVLATAALDARGQAAVRRMFPQAVLYAVTARASLAQVRRGRFEASCISMAGGGMRERLLALLSGARHQLLIPSPDYIYRLGMRQGCPALAWAVIDRFLVAPVALMWLVLLVCWLYVSGLVGRTAQPKAQGG